MDSRNNRSAVDALDRLDESGATVRRQLRHDDDERRQRRDDRSRRERGSRRHDLPGSPSPYRHRRRHESHHDRPGEHRRDRYTRDASDGSADSSVEKDRRRRERSRSYERSPPRRRSRSPPRRQRRRSYSRSRSPPRRSQKSLPSQDESFRRDLGVAGPNDKAVEKQKPNFKPTGLLAKEANTVAGTSTVLKYHEPPEARKPPPREKWRMYVFKKKDLLDTVHLHQRSCWLMGRDQKVTDLLLEHPSISKQHAVIQFRYLTTTNEFGDKAGRVKPYLIDLESANGTRLNGDKVETSRFIELVDSDVVSFGDSDREYVLMLPPTE